MTTALSVDIDHRLGAYCVTARTTYKQYLIISKGSEKNLAIQRSLSKGAKAYSTLRADIKRGCVLPPIVLALRNPSLPPALGGSPSPAPEKDLQSPETLDQLSKAFALLDPETVYIIDGLQRTSSIRQVASECLPEEKETFLAQTLRLEIWLNIPFGAVAYRMLLLNAGQRPMSIKNQIEILSQNLAQDLEAVPGLALLNSLESQRRNRPGQFHLSKIAAAFQAWLQGQPNIDIRNAVMEQMLADSAIETLGSSLSGATDPNERDSFRQFVTWLVALDTALAPEHSDFFPQETVLLGFAAAVGAAEKKPAIRERMRRSIEQLVLALESDPSSDPLGIDHFLALRQGIDVAKKNVGQATRDMVWRAFHEHFASDGTRPMTDCWEFAANA